MKKIPFIHITRNEAYEAQVAYLKNMHLRYTFLLPR